MFEDLKPHIEELRKRLIIIVVAFVLAFLACFSQWEILLGLMIAPLEEALRHVPDGGNVIFTDLTEPLFTALKVSFFAAFIVSLPVIFWQSWQFVAPGLYQHEKKLVIPFVFFATTMFIAGAAFAYFVVFPLGFYSLIQFGSTLYQALPKIGEYVGFFTKLMLAFGITFELPVVTFFLAKMGLVTDQSLKHFFRYAIVIIFIIAALLTPPDVLSQFLMALPLILLYGVSILIAKAINPEKPHDDEPDDITMPPKNTHHHTDTTHE